MMVSGARKIIIRKIIGKIIGKKGAVMICPCYGIYQTALFNTLFYFMLFYFMLCYFTLFYFIL